MPKLHHPPCAFEVGGRLDYLPHNYDGSTNALANWLQFDDFLTIQGIDKNSPEAIARFKFTLGNNARIWARNREFHDLESLKKQFLEHFSGVHSREACVEVFSTISYKPGESVDAYLTKIRQMSERLGYSAQLAKDRFIQGLPKEIRRALACSNASTIEEYQAKVEKLLDIEKLNTPKELTFVSLQEDFGRMSVSDRPRRSDRRSKSDRYSRSSSRSYSRDRNRHNRNKNKGFNGI